jgi:hypothetical protein
MITFHAVAEKVQTKLKHLAFAQCEHVESSICAAVRHSAAGLDSEQKWAFISEKPVITHHA